MPIIGTLDFPGGLVGRLHASTAGAVGSDSLVGEVPHTVLYTTPKKIHGILNLKNSIKYL